jgi:hypothetical protein
MGAFVPPLKRKKMSTRANVVLSESYSDSYGKKVTEKMYFYRHSDGYPEGTLPSLNKFMEWLKAGKIRDNLTQASGWLVVLGALEYDTIPKCERKEPITASCTAYAKVETIEEPKDWKAGAFEPTTCIHGDIQWLYEINLTKRTLTYKEV